MILRVLLVLGLALFSAIPAMAEGLGPAIPKATGDPHPEGNAYMRRWHMSMMLHDRDETMYNGVRPAHASIGQCFECHAVRDEAGTFVTYDDERHFCRACHDFASVKVDCFDCHRSTPEGFEEPAAHAAWSGSVSTPEADANMIADLQEFLNPKTGEVRP